MAVQTIGAIRVQVGQSTPRVSAVNTGGFTQLKNANDVNISGGEDGDVLVFRSATKSFELEPLAGVPIGFDAGTF